MLLNLFPHAAHLIADHVTIDPDGQRVTLTLRSCQPQATCPRCQHPARRCHSRYTRQIRDLPMVGYALHITLLVRKFFCETPQCPQRIFAERLPDLVAPLARRTLRLAAEQRQLTIAYGGEAAARTAHRQHMAVSPRTLLRLVRRTPPPVRPTPRVLGVDDFAFRKGRTYGTILVDLETRVPVDLLPDRTAATLAAWLADHPGVEMISRDRALDYADGARRGAPTAIHIADRFHLLLNLREALQRFLDHQHAVLRAVTRPAETAAPPPASHATDTEPSGQTAGPPLLSAPASGIDPAGSARAALADARRAARMTRYEAVRALQAEGWGIRAIARHLQLSRQTVRHFAGAVHYPERATPASSGRTLIPHLPFLREQLAAGVRNGMQLWRTLRDDHGYTGSRALVSAWVARHRHLCPPMDPATPAQQRGRPPRSPQTPFPPSQRRLSARSAAWLLVRRPEELLPTEHQLVQRLGTQSPLIQRAHELAQAFLTMVRDRTADDLDAWLTAAASQPIPALKTFAAGIQRDKAAVVAGLTQPWSNGQTEGQINRLKFIKRSGYGRANFDLLRQRVLAQ